MAFSAEIALQSLQRALASNRLAHAYLIAGADEPTRRKLAAQLTALALGLPDPGGQIPVDPDVRVVEPALKSRQISIEAIQEFCSALSLRASRAGGRKAGVVLDAERMTVSATNAFLKTLEEPPGDSLLLLVSGRSDKLYDTILSRCIRIELIDSAHRAPRSPRENMISELLDGVAARSAGSASPVANAYGALREFQAVLGAAKEEIRGEEEAQFEAAEDKYERKDHADWLDEREEYHKVRVEARYVAERERLVGAVTRWWQTALHASLGMAVAATPAQAAVAARLSTTDILRRIERLENLHDWLGRNIQEALALEVAFLDVFA